MKGKYLFCTIAVLALNAGTALADNNNFFGGYTPGGPPNGEPGAGNAPINDRGTTSHQSGPPPAGPSDYSDDEKRMRKKYRGNMNHAKDLIDKGNAMMKEGEKKHDDKEYKKGKIFKEIGEKTLADLEANSPFPSKDDDKDKGKSTDEMPKTGHGKK
jgi:hypothetical protein